MSKRALITGVAGFIGSNLADLLLQEGYSVVGIDNLWSGSMLNIRPAMTNSQFEFIGSDLLAENLIDRVSGSIDIVFHLAAISSVKLSVENPTLVNKTNIDGTVAALELAKAKRARRFVFSSSAAVYGDPESLPVTETTQVEALSPYAQSKIDAENHVMDYQKNHGLDAIVLRYFNVYGPRQAYSAYSGVISIFINQALAGKNITIDGDGEQTRSFIYVDDVCNLTQKAGELDALSGETINISGTESMTINALASMVRNMTATKSKIIHGAPREGDVRKSIGSMTKAKQLLGYTGGVEFQTGLVKTIEWYHSSYRE